MDNSEAQKKERGKEVKKRIIALSLVLAMSASLTFPVAAARKDEVQAEKAATESKLKIQNRNQRMHRLRKINSMHL